jgi:hypothetical protein
MGHVHRVERTAQSGLSALTALTYFVPKPELSGLGPSVPVPAGQAIVKIETADGRSLSHGVYVVRSVQPSGTRIRCRDPARLKPTGDACVRSKELLRRPGIQVADWASPPRPWSPVNAVAVDPNYNLWAVDRCETDDCIPVIEPDLTARHLPQSERVDTRFHAHGDGLRESTNMCERGPGQQEEIQKCSSVGRSMPERRATETANSRTPVLWIGQQKPFAKTGRGGDG